MCFGTEDNRKSGYIQSGFTLVELSIVIIIIGLLTAGGLTVGASMVERAAYIDTQKLLKQLQRSVKDFYVVNGRLPCVASFDDMPGSSDFGKEVFDPVVTPSNCADSATVPAGTFRRGSPAVRIGMIPTRALGLPDSAASDKYGNRIVYAVSAKLTDANQFGAEQGAITVEDMGDNAMLTDGAFFIGSVGRDREGGYDYKTTSINTACDTSSTSLDVHNCDYSDAIFRDAPFNNGDVENRFFDDITAWTPKFHLTGSNAFSDTLWAANGDANLYSVGTNDNTADTSVGIGTASPQAGVHVARGSRALRLEGDTHVFMELYPTGPATRGGWFGFGSASSDSLTIRNEIDGAHLNLLTTGSGNVGIGMTTPEERMHVAGNLQVNTGFMGVGGHGGVYMHVSHPNYKGAGQYALLQDGRPTGHTFLNSVNDGNLYFRNDNINRMVMLGDEGFFGIGTPSPKAGLHVTKIGRLTSSNNLGSYPPGESNSFAAIIEGLGTDDGGLFIRIGDNNGDEKALDIWNEATDSVIMRVKSNARVGIGTGVPAAVLEVNTQVPGSVNVESLRLARSGSYGQHTSFYEGVSGHLVYFYSEPDNAKPAVFNVTTNSAGTAPSSGGNAYYFRIRGTDKFRISANGNAWLQGTLAENSDMRLKRDIEPVENALEKLKQLRGVTYRWNGKGGQPDTETRYMGLLAQDVQAVFPEAVLEQDNGYLSLDSSALTAPLIEAIKQLEQQNARQAEEITALSAQLADVATPDSTTQAKPSTPLRPLDILLLLAFVGLALYVKFSTKKVA